MEQTWRWFGPRDKVKLQEARQAGAEGIVTALHEIPVGEIWPIEAIRERQQLIEKAGLCWSVVESLDVAETVKTRSGAYRAHTENFIASLRNLATCGIKTVAYNFMPIFSWMRTDLHMPLDNGGFTTGFSVPHFAAFDLFQLRRKNAENDWSKEQRKQAEMLYASLAEREREALEETILQGLPGGNGRFTLQKIRELLDVYAEINPQAFRANMSEFLRAVCPVAEELKMRLCLHPDDPPRPLLGLPRIVSTADDLAWILEMTPEESNGFTFCTGALGVRADNDLAAMVRRFAPRIGFAHLRSTQRFGEANSASAAPIESFFEACHLEGDVDLIDIVIALVQEERRRAALGDEHLLPFRSDHGQELLDDPQRKAYPGYPAVGRLRGLAELRGAMRTAERLLME